MIYNIPCRSNPIPFYKAPPVVDPDLIWYVNFENGLYQPFSDTTGTNGDATRFQIMTDQQMGKYLKCTRTNTSNTQKVYWAGSKDYLNNILNSTAPFSVSFWLRAPNWNSYNQQVIICWKTNDSGTGLVMYRDGGNPSKLDARLSYQNNFFTSTNVANSSWVHWVFVRNSSGAIWYRNGTQDNTNSNYGSKVVTASENISIGYCAAWICNAYFDVTKYRIYKRALTSAEILNLYNNKM